jgi:hypothetical protein
LTYVGQSGSTESGSVLWTNEANWATMNDPGKISLRNWEADLGISTTVADPSGSGAVLVHENKYLNVRLSEMHGVPIYTRLESGARRNVTPAGYVFGRHREDLYKSPASSSSSYQQNGGAGGTKKKSYPLPHYIDINGRRRKIDYSDHNPCDKGYVPRKVRGRWMCVPVPKGRSHGLILHRAD